MMLVQRLVVLASLGALSFGSMRSAPCAAAQTPAIQPAPAPYVPSVQRFARAGASGARAFNAADLQAVPMSDLAPGTLLAVHAESAGFLMVECPGGIPAWVFGAYVRPSEREGVYEVTGSRVNVRPRPSSDTNSYPLPRPLQQGDQVLAIERADPAKPLAEDWLRIWSPPSICFWIQKSATTPLDAASDGAKLWSETSAALLRARPAPWKAGIVPAQPAQAPKGGTTTPGAPATSGVPAAPPAGPGGALSAADAGLAAAKALLAAERGLPAPDFAPVRSAYEAVLSLASLDSNGPTAEAARADLELVGVLEAAARMTREIEVEKARRAAEIQRQAEILRQESQKKDPLLAVYDAYGRVERVTVDGTSRYFLAVAGQRWYEVSCSSARYDLNLFTRYEVGVKGVRSEATQIGALPRIDVERLQILSAAR